jgi:hypothetical protein
MVQQELKKMDVLIMKDPYYLNKKGESRFMISVNTIQEYNTTMQSISDMISNHLNKDKKLNYKKKSNIPRPLNIII